MSTPRPTQQFATASNPKLFQPLTASTLGFACSNAVQKTRQRHGVTDSADQLLTGLAWRQREQPLPVAALL